MHPENPNSPWRVALLSEPQPRSGERMQPTAQQPAGNTHDLYQAMPSGIAQVLNYQARLPGAAGRDAVARQGKRAQPTAQQPAGNTRDLYQAMPSGIAQVLNYK